MPRAIAFVKLLPVLFLAPILGGCPGHGGSGPGLAITGQSPILPTQNLKVGRLYFEGSGRRPAFQMADGRVYSEICYADYDITSALKGIGKYISVSDTTSYAENTTTVGNAYALNVTGIKLGILSGQANFNYNPSDELKTVNARPVTLSDEGINIVRKSLSPGCRKEIADKRVILVADAIRADSATLTTSNGYTIGGGASFGGTISGSAGSATISGPGINGSGGRTSKSTTTFRLVYIYLGDGNSFVP